MGKRKRNGPLKKGEEQASEFEDTRGSRLNIRSYEDVADSEDEFHLGRDKIALEGVPQSKRRRQHEEEDAFLEHSDEEILAGDASNSDVSELDEDDGHGSDLDLVGAEDDDVSDDDETDWGKDKSAYYNADEISNDEDADLEAEEARRLQKKRIVGDEEDFGLGEDGLDQWAKTGAEEDEEEGGQADRELAQLQISDGMTEAQKSSLLKERYPDFEEFAKDLVTLEPTWRSLQSDYKNAKADQDVSTFLILTKLRAVSAYLAALSIFFAVLTSPAVKNVAAGGTTARALAPTELREHGILDSIRQAQQQWESVKDVDVKEALDELSEDGANDQALDVHDANVEDEFSDGLSGVEQSKQASQPKLSDKRAARMARTEASLAALDDRLAAGVKARPSVKDKASILPEHDLGDEVPLTAEQAAEKARKRKSLRFYTSQIAQRHNKRSGAAARAAQGDDDLPYRERWRDRVERLNREAEARGRRAGEDDEEDARSDEGMQTNAQRAGKSGDSEYDELMGAAARKKAALATRDYAYREAKKTNGRVVRQALDTQTSDGRREIGYAIEANKGLTPKRKKVNKNPRVKKRLKYEDKSKKLRSMKPTFKGGEGRGGYGGELTGIKKGNVRSVKF